MSEATIVETPARAMPAPAGAAPAWAEGAPGQQVDLAKLRAASVQADPFPYVIVPGFLRADAAAEVLRDYPKLAKPGSFPLPSLRYGPAFSRLMDEIQGPEMTAAISRAFGIDLSGRPTMVTVRGMCRARDGQIHTDSRTKLVTVLLYMNDDWAQDGGRLRLLRSATDLDDMVAEVPPEQGTLLAFLNTPNAWHGHKSFEGPRRVLQLNWVTDEGVVQREQKRHRFSAFMKKINPFR